MAYLKNQAYRDTVEITKAALSAANGKNPWINEQQQDATCEFIQKVYDKLCSIATDAAED